ncbi:hypothetical protein ACWEOA_13450 [Streptomyces sp. NPDC004457]
MLTEARSEFPPERALPGGLAFEQKPGRFSRHSVMLQPVEGIEPELLDHPLTGGFPGPPLLAGRVHEVQLSRRRHEQIVGPGTARQVRTLLQHPVAEGAQKSFSEPKACPADHAAIGT